MKQDDTIYIVHGQMFDDYGNPGHSRVWGVYQDKNKAIEMKEDLERVNEKIDVNIQEDYLV